ncbi:MAG: response regulator transcription factor [Bacteroidota bacterium]
MLKVGIVEDQEKLIGALLDKLSVIKSIEVLWVAVNGKEAIDKNTNAQPDVILMDIQMPVMDGIEATQKIKTQYSKIKIIMLTIFDQDDKIMRAIVAGADGYLLKDEGPAVIEESIKDVLDGGAPMSKDIAFKTLKLIQHLGKGETQAKQEIEFDLSKREMEVLTELAKGHSYQVIAQDLFISPKTVRKHIENIYRKLQVHNKIEAVHLAMKQGWV